MASNTRKFTTNSRLVNELFANYISTFAAFCELINNSIQADAKNIWIELDYTGEDELHPLIIKGIKIKDDGRGVHLNELDRKILDIGTTNKEDGKGIGRFAAFQIGKTLQIETIGFDTEAKTFSKATIPLSFDQFGNNINVSEIDLKTSEEILSGTKHKTFYQVIISDLYPSTVTDKEPRKKIIDKFLKANIADAIFERYPLKIFNKDIIFHINGKQINPKDFVVGQPIKKTLTYQDKKGDSHKIQFDFIQIKKVEKIKIFLTTRNAGIQTIANGFEYDATWLSPKIGGWFVYINSSSLPSDMYRNVDLDGMDEKVKHYKDFVKAQLNDFFRERNREYDNFTEKLKKDEFYPYKESASSQSKVLVFEKLAYLVEDKYNLLNEQNRLREVIYPLIDRTISNGELENVLKSILKLNNKMITKFSDLIEKTEMENLIEFSDKVATKLERLIFLDKIVHSEIAEHLKERKELHKILEKMLWVFGEEYNDSTHLLSDRNLENNLSELRASLLKYKPSEKDDNEAKLKDKKLKSITDLFLYSEKIIDSEKREVLIVELKAPRVKISPKELEQVMKYAQEIEEKNVFSDRITYKILLVSSDINKRARFDIKGRQKGQTNPYFYFKNEAGNIEVWVIKWTDIIEQVKRKLTYMSNVLNLKDVNVKKVADRDFAEIEFGKTFATLKKVAV